MKYLTLDIGGTFTKFGVADQFGNFCFLDKVPTMLDSEDSFIKMLFQIHNEIEDEISGIAISSTGIIDSVQGIMHTGGSLFCISGLEIVKLLQKKCMVPVTIENDAKCAALAELWKGSLVGCNTAVVIIIGTAVGGAVIIDGEILNGHHSIAGEFSYLITSEDSSDRFDNLLANRSGIPALIKNYSVKSKIPKNKLNGEKIFFLAENGDKVAKECIREYARILAIHITNFQFIIDPEKIVIGGGVSVQNILIQMIRKELISLNKTYPHELPIPEVTVCKYHNDSNLIGALYVHLKKQL